MSLAFGPFAFDPERRQLLRQGEPVPLEAKAFELLSLLLARRPRVLSKAQIRDVLWPGISVGATSLPRLVAELRQALGEDARQPRFIRTVHGFGYAFCGEAHEGADKKRPGEAVRALAEERPYPGLAAFTEADAGRFFGREAEVAALWEKLGRQKLLAVIGPSGVGKTSFLRAGVIAWPPAGWGTAYLTPGPSPAAGLARALTPSLASDPDVLAELVQGAMELVESGDDEHLVSAVSRWRRKTSQALLVVDQFEELYTLNPDETQERFAALLGRLAEESDVHVLLSLRDDFLFRCHASPSLAPVFREVTPLGPPSPESLRKALVEPAARLGVRFEDETLPVEMVRTVEEERGALPLLAFAVSRLWEERDREKKLLTRAAYARIRGVEGALAEHAEATLREIGPEREGLVRELFRNLVTAEGTRAAREREELLSVFPAGSDREEAEAVLDVLVGARLLTGYDDPEGPVGGGRRRIEIVHESLLTHWPRLERWRAQDQGGALLRDHLRQAARLWDEKGRPEELLWTGPAYRELALWRERYPGGLTGIEEAFAEASTALAGRRRRRRRLAVAALLVAATAVAVTTSSLWRRSETARGRAESEILRAEASKLLAMSQSELETFPTAALAYVTKSLELADTEVARLFALRVLQRAPTVLSAPAEQAHAAAFSPNDEWLAFAGGRVRLLHRDGRPPVLLGDYSGECCVDVGFGPGSDVLVANRNGDVRVWSLPDAREVRRGAFERGAWGGVWVYEDGFLTSTTVGPRQFVRWWPLGHGEPRLLGSIEPHDVIVTDASPRWLGYASGRRIFVRSLQDWTAPPHLVAEDPGEAGVRLISFSPDGERLAAFARSGEIRIWSMAGRKDRPLRVLHAKEMNPAGLVFSADGKKLALFGGAFGRPAVRLWDLHAPPTAEPLVLQRTDTHSLVGMAVDSAGHWAATAHGNEVGVWPLDSHEPRVIAREHNDVVEIAFTADGKWLVSASNDGDVRASPLSPVSGTESRLLLQTRESGGITMALAPSGPPAVAVAYPRRLRVVPLDGGPAREIQGFSPNSFVKPLAFGDGGRLLAAASGDPTVVRVWNLETGAMQAFVVPTPGGKGIEVSVDYVRFLGRDSLLASGRTYTPKGVSPDPGLLRFDLRDGTVRVLGLSTNGDFTVSRGGDFGVGVHDAVVTPPRSELVRFSLTGGPSVPLASHGSRVISVALDPSDSLVASGSVDGTVRIGRVSGEEPHLLLGHEGLARRVAFSPDGRWLASAGADRTVRLWPVPDLSRTPLHKRPHAELLAVLRSRTNHRAVPDRQSPAGWRLERGPFPGWAKLPEW